MKARKRKGIDLRRIDSYNRRMRHEKSGSYFQFIDHKQDIKLFGVRCRMRRKADDMIWHLHLIKWRKANNEESQTSSAFEY